MPRKTRARKTITSTASTKDGRAIPVRLTASLLVGSDGKPTGVATTERELKGITHAH
jgi:hypothetical protein